VKTETSAVVAAKKEEERMTGRLMKGMQDAVVEDGVKEQWMNREEWRMEIRRIQ
jgi:hypothetical protein